MDQAAFLSVSPCLSLCVCVRVLYTEVAASVHLFPITGDPGGERGVITGPQREPTTMWTHV